MKTFNDHPDARLIVASPDLLAALKLAESTLAANFSQSEALPAIRAAIALAEGTVKA
jgi:hypothetical protein